MILAYISMLLINFFTTSTLSNQDTISGAWSGYTTQEGANAYRQQYHFELYLHQKGSKVWGRSYSKEGEIYAEMALEGTYQNNQLYFKETKIVKFEAKTGMEWCIKQGNLTLIVEKGVPILQGDWAGSTSFSDCIPGKVFLEKLKIRA